jgi:hypothetical protein
VVLEAYDCVHEAAGNKEPERLTARKENSPKNQIDEQMHLEKRSDMNSKSDVTRFDP